MTVKEIALNLLEAKSKTPKGDEHGIIKDKHGDTYTVVTHRNYQTLGHGHKVHHWGIYHHTSKKKIGFAVGSTTQERPVIDHVEIKEKHRRKGLASALYRHIEKNDGVKLKNNSATPEGIAFRKKYTSE